MKSKFFFLAGCVVLLLASGCSNKRWYNEAHGFADTNQAAYAKDLQSCKEDAYTRFPPQSFSPSFSYPQSFSYGPYRRHYRGRYHGERPFGMTGRIAREEAWREEHQARQEAMEVMEDYNQARRGAVRYCMQDKGWRQVEVQESGTEK